MKLGFQLDPDEGLVEFVRVYIISSVWEQSEPHRMNGWGMGTTREISTNGVEG